MPDLSILQQWKS